MIALQKPDKDQANTGSMAGQLRAAMNKWLMNEVDDMMPARVVSYDDATNRAVIQPLVMVGTTSGTKISRASLPNIPVFRFGGGGFFMRFPLNPGDFGWLKANDRDISLVMQARGGEDWPNTKRLHSFSDAMFFPDTVRDWVINGADANAAVLQSVDGFSVVSVGSAGIELRVGAQVLSLTAAGLFHNGVNIGATHVHGGVQSGSSTTLVPQ